MAHFFRNGNTFRVSGQGAMDIYELLPAANYTLKADEFGNLFLELISPFELPSKLYGDTERQADRIIRTFLDRPISTGVMLVGEKGSGKTLLAKVTSVRAKDQGIPTIVINSPFRGAGFNSFIQSIAQPAIIMFDEFEKVYDDDEQEEILTLLDGAYPSKKMFVLTCNDKWRVNTNMQNRPGRIFYMLEFSGLDKNFIAEYCEDNLKNKDHIDTVCSISQIFSKFNFDMLKAMVEEMNRYDETPQEVLAMLNVSPQNSGNALYSVELTHPIHGIVQTMRETYKGNPLDHSVHVNWTTDIVQSNPNTPEQDFESMFDDDEGDYPHRYVEVPDDVEWDAVIFVPEDMKGVEPGTGKFAFVNEEGFRLVLTRKEEPTVNYWGAF